MREKIQLAYFDFVWGCMGNLNLENVIVYDLEGLAKSIETDDGKILLDSNYIEEILEKNRR